MVWVGVSCSDVKWGGVKSGMMGWVMLVGVGGVIWGGVWWDGVQRGRGEGIQWGGVG